MDRFRKSSDLVRMRAMYITLTAFIGVQLVNIGQMLYSYGSWNADINIAVAAALLVIGLLLSFRFHRKFYIASLCITGLMVAGICMSSLLDGTGINSALLPFLPVCILLAGFISGWRMALLTGGISIVLIIALYLNSYYSVHVTIFDPEIFATRNFQRAVQVSLACVMTTIITTSLSYAMHGLFQRDEDSLARVKNAERQRTAFLSSLSHEIRTPLNGIVGMSRLLLQTELSSQQNQYAGIVNECSQDLLEVMGNVMEFSQINNSRMALKPESFDVHALADSLVRRHAEQMDKSSDVILGLHIAPDVPNFLKADKKRLEMVINHLLRNAVNFTQKGSINLLLSGTKQPDDGFKLSVFVRDTGVGIKTEDLKNIYEPFHQLDNSLSRQHEGSGLGLSLCKEIIEFMGGKLGVESEIGTGSTFYFELNLPISETPSLLQPSAEELRKPNGIENVSVLRVAKSA